MIEMFPKRIVFIAILFIAFLLPQLVDAQCAMCRAVLISEEDGISNGNSVYFTWGTWLFHLSKDEIRTLIW